MICSTNCTRVNHHISLKASSRLSLFILRWICVGVAVHSIHVYRLGDVSDSMGVCVVVTQLGGIMGFEVM